MKVFWLLLVNVLVINSIVYAQEPLLDPEYPPAQKVRQIYVINQDRAPVYEHSQGMVRNSVYTRMGYLYFGIKEEHGRVLLGKYSAARGKFTQVIGWMDQQHVLKNRLPMTVGEAVSKNLLRATLDEEHIFSIKNELFLRVVAKPGSQIRPGSKPGKISKKKYFTFTWYYVYAIQRLGDHFYYLIGLGADLFDNKVITDTSCSEAQKILLGWVAREKLQEWCSNIVLEYNTAKPAISERYGKNLPATVYRAPRRDAEILVSEPLSIWEPFFQGRQKEATIRPDPFGMDPQFPRFHVLDKKNDWYLISTLDTMQQGMSQLGISRLLRELRLVNSHLCSVDLVFVVDGTADMEAEIRGLKKFLLSLCATFNQMVAQSRERIIVPLGPRSQVEFDLRMDIRVSLVLYQDLNGTPNDVPFRTKVLFPSCPVTELAQMLHKLDKIKLAGAFEPLHAGISTALTTPALWRPYALHMLFVIADEKGDSGDRTQKQVLDNMPLPPGIDELEDEGINWKECKWEYTQIFGIYTGKEGFKRFKRNLRMLTYLRGFNKRVFRIRDYETPGKPTRYNELVGMLYKFFAKSQGQIKRRLQTLAEMIRGTEDPAPFRPWAVVDRLSIRAALESAGVSLDDELYQLNEITFVKGYTQLRQPLHHYDAFRIRVCLSTAEVRALQHVCAQLAVGLRKAIKSNNRTQRPEVQMAKALLLAIAQVTGMYSEYRDNPKLLQQDARALLRSIRTNKGRPRNIRRLLKMKASLPISAKGLLGMPLKRLISLKIRDLKHFARELRLKAKCLRNILNGETTPEDPALIESHCAQAKVWRMYHPVSRVEFVFVPIQFIP